MVLSLALELLQMDKDLKITPICADAQLFMAKNQAKFDLVFIDIFDSRTVPDFVTSADFLGNCRAALSPSGRLAFNYIINSEREWEKTQRTFASIFPRHNIIHNDINRIFIAEI